MSVLARPLPSRHVTTDTIGDAYVSFILYCNPAVPHDSDAAELREAFHNLPKSGGKSFDIFTLFTLVKKLETKELKTWAELALALGVEPPDHSKGESTQKIQQFAVRLKRWMHSMHVDAFFEYLLDIPSPYWTDVPSSAILEERDGVSPSDDMAIRALVPTTRPKRVRKRLMEEDESVGASSSRSKTEWSPAGESSSTSYSHDITQPTQTTQTMPRQRRHGAKVLSSAWRSHGIGGGSSGKARGRPPASTTSAKTTLNPLPAPVSPHMDHIYTSPAPSLSPGTHVASTPGVATSSGSAHNTPPALPPDFQHRRGAFSPEQASNSHLINAAAETPDFVLPAGVPPAWPPVTSTNYPHCEPHPADEIFSRTGPSPARAAPPPEVQTGYSYNLDAAEAARGTPAASEGFFDSFTDRTNIDAILAYIVSTTKDADWYDVDGNRIPSCSVAESVVICSNMTEHLYNAAPSQSGFLINLAALLGARMLMTTTKVQMRRLGTQEGRSYYACSWEYRLGHLCGTYQMTHSIDNERLRREMGVEQLDGQMPLDGATKGGDDADVWRRRYQDALKAMDEKNEELADLKARMYETLRK